MKRGRGGVHGNVGVAGTGSANIHKPPYQTVQPPKKEPKRAGAHLAMDRKVDRRMNLLHALAARHAHPVCGRERPSGHKLGREAEGAESLQQAHDEVCRLVERKVLSQTLSRPKGQRG